VVREVTESLELTAANKNVTLRLDAPENLSSAVGDRERIRQVLVNLVENAIKYNNPGGWVAVIVSPVSPNEVRIAVSDNGIGVAPQDIPRLTERFYRVDRSRSRDQGGTGLGLAIVKHILSAHGRSLLIESKPGHGSTFAFTLPVTSGQIPRESRIA
jgi:two-component system phosphate regulon sensor histidine kinase PhoR